MCNLGLSLGWEWGAWLWTERAELILQGEASAQGHRVTPKTGLRFSPTIVQALPSHCPAHMPLFPGFTEDPGLGSCPAGSHPFWNPAALLPCEFVARV